MRKEIEAKAKIKNTEELIKKLSMLGCELSEPVEQKDTIFTNFNDDSFAEFQSGINLLRIRESGGKILFTLKQPQSNEQDAIEREVEISDTNEMAEALILMGYHEVVKVFKTRRKAKYRDYEICLDEISDLGSFVEVETITEGEADVEKIQNDMFHFLKNLGVKDEDRISQGYDTLIYLKQHNQLKS